VSCSVFHGKPLQCNLMFASKARAYSTKALSGDPHLCRLLALPTNKTRLYRPARDKHSNGLYYKHVTIVNYASSGVNKLKAGNTKGGSITVPLTSCLTGLESAV
jgi:hypothetical protein